MGTLRAFGFVDGAYLRRLAKDAGKRFFNPHALVESLIHDQGYEFISNHRLIRVTYYDARPDNGSEPDQDVLSYWKTIELLRDVQLGFGSLRGTPKKLRQKGVDTLIAVDMLSGAFRGLFDSAVLIAGDADFVPVVQEVQRNGPTVIVAGKRGSVADDLERCADRFKEINPSAAVQGKITFQEVSY